MAVALVHGDDEAQIRRNDETATDLTGLIRRMILMPGFDSEEAARKLMSVVRPGEEMELCATLVECCRQERAYTRSHGLLAERLCAVDDDDQPAFQAGFEACFAQIHNTTAHRRTEEVGGAARLYAHLLATNSVSWSAVVLGGSVRLTGEDTTAWSRVFIKVLFQELSERLGIPLLSRRMNHGDPAVREALFPTDSARNTIFAINFFTAIGLEGVTQVAREGLNNRSF